MFNPNKFISAPSRPASISGSFGSRPIVIEKSKDITKSRWDQPFNVPEVLYAKFNLPMPQCNTDERKQEKSLPQSLIEYIKRAYETCSNDQQKRQMEMELRKIISEKKSNLFQIAWQRQSLPLVNKLDSKKASQVNPIKRQKITTSFVDKVRDLEQLQEKPSKAKMKVSKMLEKFQQKLNQRAQQTEQHDNNKPQQRKMFIGFRDEPQRKAHPKFGNFKPQTVPNRSPPFPTPDPIGPAPERISAISSSSRIIQFEASKKHPSSENLQSKNSKPLTVREKMNMQERERKGGNSSSVSNTVLMKRFAEFNQLKTESVARKDVVEQEDEFNDIPIVGKSTSMEKPYLRITGRPDPEIVRPEKVLRKVLDFLLKKYRNGATYEYIHWQFKSLRQDLTVQHIRNDLTVKAYQENLKISLFENDTQTFRQYLSNLWQLYRQGIYDKKETRDSYISYLLLTQIMEERYQELQFTLTLLEHSTLQNAEVQEALKLKRACMLGNYRAFFDFYNSREDMCRYLLNQYVDRYRMKCLLMFCRTLGEKVPVKTLADTINEDEDLLELLITSEGGIIRDKEFYLKESHDPLSKSEILVVRKAHVAFE